MNSTPRTSFTILCESLETREAAWYDRIVSVSIEPVFLLGESLTAAQQTVLKSIVCTKRRALPPNDLSWVAVAAECALIAFGREVWRVDNQGQVSPLLTSDSVLVALEPRPSVHTPQIKLVRQVDAGQIEDTIKIEGRGGNEVLQEVTTRLIPRRRLNIAVFGETGVGKSTLVNAVLGREAAPAGTGLPVTVAATWYETVDGSVALVDMEGWTNVENADAAFGRFKVAMDLCQRSGPGLAIDAVWFCLAYGIGKLQDAQVDFVRKIRQINKPAFVVVLRSPEHVDDSDPFVRVVREAAGSQRSFFVNAKSAQRGLSGTPAHGLEDLLAVTRASANH